MYKNKIILTGVGIALLALPMLSSSGCSKPEETKDANGHLQFPNTGRQPTAEEMKAINANRAHPSNNN